ncbi:radical SAM domain-containing protein [Klebsiella pneumoniae]|uniref:Radical SAM domain-containing protein n=1 Tax=Klebsiella pneumoniae TaxID=573 RepID=A0A2X3CQX6_KLEPN|nr:radical SAM domain-containing protein [Klebsiella pneumoniae]
MPVILGGIEASLRRTAHYDYWSTPCAAPVLVDSKADMLMFGNGERPLVEVAHRLAMGETIDQIRDVRNTAIMVKEALPGWSGVDSTRLDTPGKIDPSRIRTVKICRAPITNRSRRKNRKRKVLLCNRRGPNRGEKTYVLLPSFEKVKGDKVLYAHASRILHHETNPGCARALMQKHGERYIWINRRQSRSPPKRWTASSRCRTSGCRILPMAMRVFRRMR